MSRTAAVVLSFLGWAPAAGLAGSLPLRVPGPSATEIVAAADRTRNGWDSFVVDVTLTTYKGEKSASASHYQVFIKGADKSLVRFADPQDKGRLLLMEPEAMWLYLPSASRPIRVTPMQRLAGNASNGDVAQMNFAAHYDAALAGEATVGEAPVWEIDLTARSKGATYQSIRVRVDKARLVPLEAEFRLTSGKTSKVAAYESYEELGGRRMLTRQVIRDLLRKDERTVIEFRNYQARDLPEKMFNRNYLHQF